MVLDAPHDRDHDLAGATALLASLEPRIRAVLAHNPLRVPLGRLAVMQPDPARAHVLYVEPDLRSPDGRRLRAVCGAYVFLGSSLSCVYSYPTPPPLSGFSACLP
jgi:hypothetical protein